MSSPKIRVTHFAGLLLASACAISLLVVSDWTGSAKALSRFRDTFQFSTHPVGEQSGNQMNASGFTATTPNLATSLMQSGCKCADIVLVIDHTTSLTAAIDNIRLGLASIITTAQTATGGDLKMGLVTFDDQIRVNQPLTTSIPDITAAVNAIAVGGGTGNRAASDAALDYVVTGAQPAKCMLPVGHPLGSFRSECFKIAVVVTDVPPGSCDQMGYQDGDDDVNAVRVANLAKMNNIIISSILVDDGSRTPSPLHPLPGGVEEFVMGSYATITGGRFRIVPANGTGTGTAIEGIIRDATPPSIVCPANITRPTDAGRCTAAVTFTVPVSDNCTGVTVSCTPPSGFAFPKGTTTVTCKATDSSGNMSQPCSFTVAVVDVEAPTPICPSNITQSTDPGVCSAIVKYTATVMDNCPGATIVCTPASMTTFQKGTTTVTCNALDASSNMASCSFTVTVVDTEKPKIACPADIFTTTGNSPVVISYPNPVVSDNCPGVTFACTPPTNSAFPIGVTTVTCTATDTSANQSSCNFMVTVEAVKCDTICFRPPGYFLADLSRVPRGAVLIGGTNYNNDTNTRDLEEIRLALKGNALGYGTLTPLQQLNKEFVAAQLSFILAGGDGSPVNYNVMWSRLHCFGLNLETVTLTNGVTFTRDSMLKELFMAARSAIVENRTADMVTLAGLFNLLNGNDPLGRCGPLRPIADLIPIAPSGSANFCAFSGGSLRVTIKNQGDAAAIASRAEVRFGSASVTVATPALQPNQSVDLVVTVPAGGTPPVTITITADSDNQVSERSRANNSVTVRCP